MLKQEDEAGPVGVVSRVSPDCDEGLAGSEPERVNAERRGPTRRASTAGEGVRVCGGRLFGCRIGLSVPGSVGVRQLEQRRERHRGGGPRGVAWCFGPECDHSICPTQGGTHAPPLLFLTPGDHSGRRRGDARADPPKRHSRPEREDRVPNYRDGNSETPAGTFCGGNVLGNPGFELGSFSPWLIFFIAPPAGGHRVTSSSRGFTRRC